MIILPKRDYEQLKNSLNIESLVMQLLPNGKGFPEWKSINPTRDDKRAGSFQVNLQSGMWIDFATDDKGDILALYSYIKGCTVQEAYDALSNNIHIESRAVIVTRTKEEITASNLIYPPPQDAASLVVEDNHGLWCYRDENGFPLMYVSRHEFAHKPKLFKPYTYRQKDDRTQGWEPIAKGMTLWPLLNLNTLSIYHDSPVLIVEGEKTADAADKILGNWVVTTWHGGSGAINRVDLEPLRGRDVWLWPDNDDGGIKAMNGLQKRLDGIANKTAVINLPRDKLAECWDLADGLKQGITREDVMELIDNKLETEKKTFQYPAMSSSKKPFPLDVTENLKYLLDFYNIKVSWNMLKRDREIIYPGKTFYNEEAANESLTLITNLAVKNGFNIRRIDKHLDAIAFENRFHPVRNWILSKPVIDKTVFDKFTSVLKTTDDKLSQLLVKKWLVSAIATVFNESDYRAQGVLVLQGKGGWQKTSFIASLVPHEMDAIYTGAHLDPSNKDSIITLSEYWIAELGELGSTFKKSDIDKLKAYVTQAKDTIRRPFAAKNSKMLRRTIFAASVNEENFLVDETGNRRWWVISLTEKINLQHGLDIQQVWRAAYDLWAAGEKPYLDDIELASLNDSNEGFEVLDPFLEKINERFEFTEPCDRWLSPTVILEMIGLKNPSKNEATRMGALLTKMGFSKKRVTKSSLYQLPILKQEYR